MDQTTIISQQGIQLSTIEPQTTLHPQINLPWRIKDRRSLLLRCGAMKCFKIQALGHKVALGQSAKQALLSKPHFPPAEVGRIWFGVDVAVHAISPSRKLKCTCPTLIQQNRATGMWSAEEGSRTSSGHWFPLCGLPPPRQTLCEVAASQGVT